MLGPFGIETFECVLTFRVFV